jgi:hypothetical protein
MGIITAISATGLAAGLALTGAHVASASTGASASTSAATASITLPSGGVLEQRVTNFCGRVPKLIERADKAQVRIGADAGTKGSLAWLKAKEAKAKAAGHKRVVNRLDRVIDRRTKRLAKLPEVKTKLSRANTECGTLDLPTPSATPSATGSSS